MGIEDRVGSLEVGKQADLILVDMRSVGLAPNTNPVSNLVYAGCGHYVDTAIVNGRILMRGRRLLTLDEEFLVARAAERSRDLLDRAGVEISPKWPVV